MKRVKSVMKSITKVLTCPVILWPILRIEYENASKGTAYVEKVAPGQGAI